ncbi:hypothetical protein [Nocardia sp. CS682]|uniref:hypothetical protein n=1 Tax=Nocardia sp. CS682 TaxID=1047172 RepID=UPI001075637D|nr:hypothetical protein [Nocardia sp. CS682]
MKVTTEIRHIHIRAGALDLEYQGCVEQVASVAAELAANTDLTVTVDDNTDPALPALPCARLWQ